MANQPVPKKYSGAGGTITPPVTVELDNKVNETATAVAAGNAPQLLVKASKDADLAKTAVRKAITQAFKEREQTVKRAEVLAQAFDEVIKGNTAPQNTPSINASVKKPAVNAQSALADIIKAYFSNRPETAVKVAAPKEAPSMKETEPPAGALSPAPDLRQVIEHVTDDQAQKKAARVITEAKSDRVASKIVMSQAQDEVRKAHEEAERIKHEAAEEVNCAREEAFLARKDAEETSAMAQQWVEQAKADMASEKKAAGLIASQAQQQALAQAAEEINKAKTEVKAARRGQYRYSPC